MIPGDCHLIFILINLYHGWIIAAPGALKFRYEKIRNHFNFLAVLSFDDHGKHSCECSAFK